MYFNTEQVIPFPYIVSDCYLHITINQISGDIFVIFGKHRRLVKFTLSGLLFGVLLSGVNL
jgi:hypothetical protein